jgi:hypothetical protein
MKKTALKQRSGRAQVHPPGRIAKGAKAHQDPRELWAWNGGARPKTQASAPRARVRTHNQNMTVAAMQMADRKRSAHLS